MCMLVLGIKATSCKTAPFGPVFRRPLPSSRFFLRGGGVCTQATAFGRLKSEEQIVIEISIRQNTPVRKWKGKKRYLTAEGWANPVEHLTAEQVAGSIPGAGPTLRHREGLKTTEKWRNFFCLQTARPSRGSDENVKWRSRLHKKNSFPN